MTLRSPVLLALVVFAFLVPAASADYTTHIGDQYVYATSAIATDASGNTYITGTRSVGDVFVTKLDPAGKIVFTVTFGGKGSDQGNAIALDPTGNIWVGGSTSSTNFPLHEALRDSGSGFLVELSSLGTIIYSSYFDGAVNGIAIDPNGNLYLTGSTDSSDFPTTPGLPAGAVSAGGITDVSGAFVTKLDPTGSHVLYSALLVGYAVDCSCCSSCFLSNRVTTGVNIVVDAEGEALIAGNSNTTNLPVTPGGTAGYGAFAAKINAAGNKLVYLTYAGPPGGILTSFGPTETINATAITTDAGGNAYLTGSTNDTGFVATPGAFQTALGNSDQSVPPADAFAVKLNPSGKVEWATYLGGPGDDGARSIALDHSGNLWLTGGNDAGFPSGQPGSVLVAGSFLAELSADGSKLLSSMELPIVGQALAIDPSGVIHVSNTNGLVSTITPSQPPASRVTGIMNAAGGQVSGRIAPGEIISIFGFGLGPTTPVGIGPAPDTQAFPTSLDGVQVLVNGVAIPLLYVSYYQINAEIPSTIDQGDATVRVINGSATLPDFDASVDASNFGIFTNPDGSAKAINQDGTVNSESNPAPAGSIVSVWGTGFGTSGPSVRGAVSTAADNWCSFCKVENQTVVYGGTSPGLIDGMMQINFVVRSDDPYFTFSLGGNAFIWVGGK
ncbi:MAG TPA: SBBP repeat-containing protein [Bryobacteraceae bacterium]|nr:SBBP repeat-containing protein [Bryobacteraceae bacterium]